MHKLFNRLKFTYATHLDKNPDYCWANLVFWARGSKPFWSLFFKGHPEYDYKTKLCEATESHCGYCGKCKATGKPAEDNREE